MNENPIILNREDYSKLRLLVTAALASRVGPGALNTLRQELDRAQVVDQSELPQGVVTMNALVEFEDLGTGEVEEYTLTFPERANVDEKRLSVLAPIGTALIGCRAGDVVDWTTPGGIRHLKIRRVSAPEQAAAPSLASFSTSG